MWGKCCFVPWNIWKHIFCRKSSCKIIRFDVMNCNVQRKKRDIINDKCVTTLNKNKHTTVRLKKFDDTELTQIFCACETRLWHFFSHNCCKQKTNQKMFLTTASDSCNLHVNLPQAGRRPQTLCITSVCIFCESIALERLLLCFLLFFSVTAFPIIRT